ncbi:D-alanyl-D-alanine carboxypeptidase/D-alanyl-D-alanine-endopeptidase [soil metagenome]
MIALVPALALFGLWRYADGRAARTNDAFPAPASLPVSPLPAPPPALGTPLLSFRRVPGLVARELSSDAFVQTVTAFGNTLDATSCMTVQLDGVDIASHNPTLTVIPASNQKLLAAAAALAVLGSDYVFTTEVRAGGVTGGVVSGDLYLVGGGDPLLTSEQYPVSGDPYPVTSPTSLDALADGVVAAGITRIDGDVVGDGSRYYDEFYLPGWSADVLGIEVGPLDALLVNDARVTGDEQRANDPNSGAAREFVQLLQARGVTVAGEVGTGAAPADTPVVASVQSAPLPAVIAEMMSSSDNNTAEMLVKEMGVASGAEGTWAAGLAAMSAGLQGLGIDVTGAVFADGSGLSNDNRVTCQMISDVLSLHVPDDALAAGLPVAGETGTLADVFVDSPVAGVMLGKTGTLGNAPFNADPPAVKALSGYLPVEGGGVIEFALILNSPGTLTDQSVYRPIWDGFADMLAGYPSGPSVIDLGPTG